MGSKDHGDQERAEGNRRGSKKSWWLWVPCAPTDKRLLGRWD